MTLNCIRRAFACWAMLGALGLSSLTALSQTNGIFADFTTSLGSFTCQLDYTNAPRTTANFIGLATGQRAWLDLPSGRALTNAFYHGLTFHRVIAGFMNQGGSPNGTGTDGPGYALMDEFSSQLVFDSFGVLAMANSGPNSDGSQFFITVAPFAAGNGYYTIFGRLVSGSNVVYAINHVATDANDKPLTNVVMQQVSIRRVGAAAQAFDINAQGLPAVTNLFLGITSQTGQVSLTFSNRLYADNQLYSTTNLSAWTAESLGIETGTPVTNTVYRTNDTPRRFYRMAQVQYPSSTFAPKSVYGRTLAMTFTNGVTGILTHVFDSAGGGSFNYLANGVSNNGTIFSYSWFQDPYRGFLWPISYSTLIPDITLTLNFNNGTNGFFTGTVYPYGYPIPINTYNVGGTFGLSGP
jgi:peptidyl-prolyl cis-trans isomerase A (cyclophilin A)